MLSDPSNPLAAAAAMNGQPAPPTTQADANVWQASVNLVKDQMNRKGSDDGSNKHVTTLLHEQSKIAIDQAREDAAHREKILRDQLESDRKERDELRRQVDKLKEHNDRESQLTGKSQVEMADIRDRQLGRVHAQHAEEMAAATKRAAEEAKTVREAHAEEIRRLEDTHRAEMSRERERSADTERRLRDNIDEERKQRIEEVKAAEAKVTEERERADKELRRRMEEEERRWRDKMETEAKAHERELRQASRSEEVKASGVVNKLEMEMELLKRQLADVTTQRDEARAEKSKSLADQMEEVERNAAVIGMTKKDPEEDATIWKIIGKGLGDGIGKAVGNADLNALASLIKPSPAAALTPRGQAPQLPAPTQRPRPVPSRPMGPRAAQWASQGSPVSSAPPPPQQQELPLGGSMVIGPEPPKTEPSAPAEPAKDAAPPEPPEPPAPDSDKDVPEHILRNLPEHELLREFGPAATLEFMRQADTAINMGVPAETFVKALLERFPERALSLGKYDAKSAITLAEAMAEKFDGPEKSALIRPDGRSWLQTMWAVLSAAIKPDQSAGDVTATPVG